MQARKVKKSTRLQSKVSDDIQSHSNSVDKFQKQFSTPFFKVVNDNSEHKEKSGQENKKQKQQNRTKNQVLRDTQDFFAVQDRIENEKNMFEIVFTPEKKKLFKESDEEYELTQKYKKQSSKNSMENQSVSHFVTFDKQKGTKTDQKRKQAQFKEHYQNTLIKVMNNPDFQMPQLCFDYNYQRQGFTSQLFAFKPNIKNGRHIRFDDKLKTCISIFRCQGCLKEFLLASALGGHLSKCPQKKNHEKAINQMKEALNNNKPLKKYKLKNAPDDEDSEYNDRELFKYEDMFNQQLKVQNNFDSQDQNENPIQKMRQVEDKFLLKAQSMEDNLMWNKAQGKSKRIRKSIKYRINTMINDDLHEDIEEEYE